ncbi:MAG: hypothetical protein AAGC46_00550 [Solirubrobacteraceae bacterium]|nr:hypothetical protein [Patulibacter sp.]
MLLRHGLIVMAVAAAVGGAGVALREDASTDGSVPGTNPVEISTALPVSRRAEPSIDRYTWTDRATTPLKRMTSAQRWISAHARPFVAYDSAPTVSRNLLGWATHPDIQVYVNAAGPNAYNRTGVRDAAKYLLKAGGQVVHVDGWDVIDIRNPDARHWWLYGSDGQASCTADPSRRAALDLIACGYEGLWVDDVLTDPSWYTPNPRISAAQWGDAEVALLRELRAALPATATFTINAHWTDVPYPSVAAATPLLDPNSALVRAAATADQLVIEGGAIDAGLVYGGALADPYSYPRLLAYVDALHAAGAHVQYEKVNSGALVASDPRRLGTPPPCSDQSYRRQPGWKVGSAAWKANVRASAFNLATALLTFTQGDGVGDICDYPGRSFRGYGQDLGLPLGDRATNGPLVIRQFSGGMVAVNPTLQPATVGLPPGRIGINLASVAAKGKDDRTAASYAVGPRSAVIVQFSPAAAVATTP